jgi:hypothetical protein
MSEDIKDRGKKTKAVTRQSGFGAAPIVDKAVKPQADKKAPEPEKEDTKNEQA